MWGGLPIPNRLKRGMVLLGVRKFPVGVTAAIPDGSGRLLMFRHTYRGRYPWGLPSGWLEPGEQPGAAVVREIYEETRLEISEPQFLLVHSAGDAHHLDLVYSARLTGGEFHPSPEVSGMAWFGPDELPELMASQQHMIGEIYRALGDLHSRRE
jgi:ADP-ribose pyrophosphatase YjhB (NUDIX family)